MNHHQDHHYNAISIFICLAWLIQGTLANIPLVSDKPWLTAPITVTNPKFSNRQLVWSHVRGGDTSNVQQQSQQKNIVRAQPPPPPPPPSPLQQKQRSKPPIPPKQERTVTSSGSILRARLPTSKPPPPPTTTTTTTLPSSKASLSSEMNTSTNTNTKSNIPQRRLQGLPQASFSQVFVTHHPPPPPPPPPPSRPSKLNKDQKENYKVQGNLRRPPPPPPAAQELVANSHSSSSKSAQIRPPPPPPPKTTIALKKSSDPKTQKESSQTQSKDTNSNNNNKAGMQRIQYDSDDYGKKERIYSDSNSEAATPLDDVQESLFREELAILRQQIQNIIDFQEQQRREREEQAQRKEQQESQGSADHLKRKDSVPSQTDEWIQSKSPFPLISLRRCSLKYIPACSKIFQKWIRNVLQWYPSHTVPVMNDDERPKEFRSLINHHYHHHHPYQELLDVWAMQKAFQAKEQTILKSKWHKAWWKRLSRNTDWMTTMTTTTTTTTEQDEISKNQPFHFFVRTLLNEAAYRWDVYGWKKNHGLFFVDVYIVPASRLFPLSLRPISFPLYWNLDPSLLATNDKKTTNNNNLDTLQNQKDDSSTAAAASSSSSSSPVATPKLRRVVKVRKVPKKTLLSDLNLQNDNEEEDDLENLTDEQFDELLNQLEYPEEIEEEYSDFEEYVDEDLASIDDKDKMEDKHLSSTMGIPVDKTGSRINICSDAEDSMTCWIHSVVASKQDYPSVSTKRFSKYQPSKGKMLGVYFLLSKALWKAEYSDIPRYEWERIYLQPLSKHGNGRSFPRPYYKDEEFLNLFDLQILVISEDVDWEYEFYSEFDGETNAEDVENFDVNLDLQFDSTIRKAERGRAVVDEKKYHQRRRKMYNTARDDALCEYDKITSHRIQGGNGDECSSDEKKPVDWKLLQGSYRSRIMSGMKIFGNWFQNLSESKDDDFDFSDFDE